MLARWVYKLDTGVILRDAIEENDNEGTLEALRKCFKEINEKLPNVYTEDELDEDIEKVNNLLDSLENDDIVLDDCENEINTLLEKFYEYCDDMKIWIEV